MFSYLEIRRLDLDSVEVDQLPLFVRDDRPPINNQRECIFLSRLNLLQVMKVYLLLLLLNAFLPVLENVVRLGARIVVDTLEVGLLVQVHHTLAEIELCVTPTCTLALVVI